VAGQAGCAWRWQMLARIGGIDRRLSDFLKFYFIGIFTNLFVPGLIGGDFARTIYLTRTREFLSRAAASVAADRVVGLLALVWFAAATAATLGIGRLPAAATTPLITLGAVSLAGFAASPLMFRAVRAMPDRLSSIGRLLEPYFEKRAALLPLILFSVAMHALQVVCQYILARGIGLQIPFSVFLICVPVTNALATLPITLNGLGVREGLYVLLFSAMGVSRPDAVAMGILWFGCSAAGGLVGAPAFVTSKTPILTRKG
jgi:glycosyltransferase 2 family protein